MLVFLRTIKVFKYEAEQKPVLVREILCENNLMPAMDYGPRVIFFSDCMYYFKRIIKSKSGTYFQLFKYNFELDVESEIVIFVGNLQSFHLNTTAFFSAHSSS